jgi:hypothetical protein
MPKSEPQFSSDPEFKSDAFAPNYPIIIFFFFFPVCTQNLALTRKAGTLPLEPYLKPYYTLL